ncbi:hypothetical protein TDB9533_00544 [Thalassocella blandensis]|nr:hypothetical protein TDB9533_00544 [Thalassocella blandensis]
MQIKSNIINSLVLVLLLLINSLTSALTTGDNSTPQSTPFWKDAYYEAKSFFVVKHYFNISLKTLPASHLTTVISDNSTDGIKSMDRVTINIDIPGIRSTTSNYFNAKHQIEYSTEYDLKGDQQVVDSYITGNQLTTSIRQPYPPNILFKNKSESNTIEEISLETNNDIQTYTNYFGLFYFLTKGVLTKPSDRSVIDYFNDGKLTRVKLCATEFVKISSSYTENNGKNRKKNFNTVTSLKITVHPEEESSINIIGLTKEINFYLDIKRNLIIRIDGSHPIFGYTRFNLKNLRT